MTGDFPRDVESGEPARLSKWRGRTGCPAPELLLPAREGTLPEPLLGAVRAHLGACPLCTELAAALESAPETPAETARITARVFRNRVSRGRYWPALAAAAAVTIVAGATYVVSRVERTPAAPIPFASRANAPAPPQRAAVLALAAPAIELPPESLALRSDGRNTYAAALERALEFYQRGDYKIAAARLERVVRANPRRPHPQFYLGASLLMRGDAAAAVRPIARARELAGPGASLYPVATWYLAVALDRSGRGAEALEFLVELCGAGGARSDQACDGLSRLLDSR